MLPHEPFLPRTENGRMLAAYILTTHPLRDGSHGFEEFVHLDSMNENVVLVLVPQKHPKAGFQLIHRDDIVTLHVSPRYQVKEEDLS